MAYYKQTSFAGGLNFLLDDTRLPVSFKYKEGDTPYDITFNQYRLGFNMRPRFDVADPIASSVLDNSAPAGLKQGIVTFGNYILLFVAGNCYYKLNTQYGWVKLDGFNMSPTASRVYTVTVPINTTLFATLALQTTSNSNTFTTSNNGVLRVPIPQNNYVASTLGNYSGILVQDGVTQPFFIYINKNGYIATRITQTYSQWSFPLNPATLAMTGPDDREYVPIGTYMAWNNGILFIVSSDFNYIYRSVSGRPLDFVVNVDINGNKGGDATTTSFSVGVGGITAMKTLADGSLFVAAGGGICISVSLNTTPNAPTLFGEYTFLLKTLFNSSVVNEKSIVDINGDTIFIDTNGLRSFNAIEQQQNEGRNSVFSANVQRLFNNITQNDGYAAAIQFDNFVYFAVDSVFGYVLVVYDTINSVWSSIDTNQLNGSSVKQFASINVSTLALYAISSDDKVYQLYADSSNFDNSAVRFGAVCSQDPRKELKLAKFRCVFSNITKDTTINVYTFVNNRLDQKATKTLSYQPDVNTFTVDIGPDVGTQVNNVTFPFPNSQQGWKAFVYITWNNGASLTDVSIETIDITPQQPYKSQSALKQ